MLRKMATRAFIGAWAILSLAAAPTMAQGISRQDYSGLDKYMSQGRPDNSSFVGVRAAEFLTIPIGARGIANGQRLFLRCR